MAVIDSIPGIKVFIRLNRSRYAAEEYPDPHMTILRYDREAYNYIESIDNADFSICCEVEEGSALDEFIFDNQGLQFCVFLDGKPVGRRFCGNDDFRNGLWSREIWGNQAAGDEPGVNVMRRFKFAPVTTIEDDDVPEEYLDRDIERAQDLGTICVVVRLVEHLGDAPIPTKKRSRRFQPEPQHFEINEKALKGRVISHGASFSRTGKTKVPGGQFLYRDLNGHRPVAIFTFKYRSMEALKQEFVVLRTPSPEPLPEQRAVPVFEELADDQIELLARQRLNQLQEHSSQQAQSRKRGIDDVYDLTEEYEYGAPERFKMTRLDNGHDGIDLTGDY